MEESDETTQRRDTTPNAARGRAVNFFLFSFGYVGIRFLLVPVRTRLLTEWLPKELYGSLNLAIMTVTLLATALSLGSFVYLVRHLPGRPPAQQAGLLRLILARIAVPAWIAVVLGAFAWGLFARGGAAGRVDSILLGAGFVLSSLLLHRVFYFLGRAEMGRMRATQMLQNDLWFVPLLLLGAGSSLTFTWSMAVWVGWLALVVLATWRWLPWRVVRDAPRPTTTARDVLHFGLPLLPMMAGEAAFRVADRYILLGCTDLATLAEYTLCANIAMIVFVVGDSLLDMVTPVLFEQRNCDPRDAASYRPGPEVRALFGMMLRYAVGLGAVACVGLAVFSLDVLRLLSAPSFHRAAALLPWLGATPLFFLTSAVAGRGLMAIDRTRIVGAATVAAALLNLALNLVLVPRWGGIGAGLANTASLAMLTFYLGHRLGWRAWTDLQAFRPRRIAGAVLCCLAWFYAVHAAILPAAVPVLRLFVAGVSALALLAVWGVLRVDDAHVVRRARASTGAAPHVSG